MFSARLASALPIAIAAAAALAGCGGNPTGSTGPGAAPSESTPVDGDGSDFGTPPSEEDGTECGCDTPATDTSGDNGASDSGGTTDNGGDSGGEGDLRWVGALRAAAAPAAAPAPQRCVRGIVEDAQGQPVAGASVVIAPSVGAAITSTGRAGHFCLGWDPARTAFVAVVAPDGARAWSILDTASPKTLDARGCAALRAVVARP